MIIGKAFPCKPDESDKYLLLASQGFVEEKLMVKLLSLVRGQLWVGLVRVKRN